MESEPRVVQMIRRLNDALLARDWGVLDDLFADSFHLDDRRSGLQSLLDKAGTLAMFHVVVDLGMDAIDLEILETRGERIAFYRVAIHASDFVVLILGVTEIGADGRQLVGVYFDEDNFDAAIAELESLASAVAE